MNIIQNQKKIHLKTVGKIITSIILAFVLVHLSEINSWSCDIAVVSARVTTNGRPFIWKNRDCSANWHQEIKFFDAVNPLAGGYTMVYNFDDIAAMNNGTPVNPSGGVNEAGFATACTSVYEDLNPMHEALNINTELIRKSLQECVTISDYDNLLLHWHESYEGHIISGNFVVIDAYGGAALYECYTGSGDDAIKSPVMFKKYDANTGRITNEKGEVIEEGSNDFIGFHNRTNANTYIPYNFGEERRWRAVDILTDLSSTGKLNYKNAMRYLARDVYGKQMSQNNSDENYSTTYCISRAATRLGMVIDGVKPGRDPKLSVFWCNLGEPSIGVFTPFFAHAKDVSYLTYIDAIDIDGKYYDLNDTCLMNRAMNRREIYDHLMYRTNTGDVLTGMDDITINKIELAKVQEWTFPLEDIIINKTEEYVRDMRRNPGLLTEENLRIFSDYCAQFAYKNYNEASSSYYIWDFNKPWAICWFGN